MTESRDKAIKLRDDVSLVVIDDEGLLLDVAKRCYYSVNQTAALLLQKLQTSGLALDNLCQHLLCTYEADPLTVQEDTKRFVAELERWELVVPSTVSEPVSQPAGEFPRQKGYQPPLLTPEAPLRTVIATQSYFQMEGFFVERWERWQYEQFYLP